MDDLGPFESPKLLIEGAKARIAAFDVACRTFLNGCDYDAVERPDHKNGERVVSLRFQKRILGDLRVLASGILNDLRHALDQAVCDSAVELGRPDSSGVYFPIGKEPSDLDREVKNRCKNVHPDLANYVRTFNAHSGRDDFLYTICSLAGPNKHQRILRMSLGDGGVAFDGRVQPFVVQGPAVIGIDRWNELRNELEIIRLGPGGRIIQMDCKPLLQIVIGAGAAPLSAGATTVFERFATKVETIVQRVEQKTADIRGR